MNHLGRRGLDRETQFLDPRPGPAAGPAPTGRGPGNRTDAAGRAFMTLFSLLLVSAVTRAAPTPSLRLLPPHPQLEGPFQLLIRSADEAALLPERVTWIEVLTSTNPASPLDNWSKHDLPRTLTNGSLRVDFLPADSARTAAYFVARETSAAQAVTVRDAAGLRAAVAAAQPGARILLAPGRYPGGFSFSNLRGETNRPVVIAAADPQNPPVIEGGANGMQLSDPAFVELHDLVFHGATGNGLNIDDGGSFDTPAREVLLRGLRVTDVGPQGNRDGIKLSGVVGFRVENCTVERWGTGGSAVDMVGCHAGVIQGNLFRHTVASASEGANGVQTKGGSREVTIRRNRFEHAGSRAVNIGGSTGLQFFRPPLAAAGEHWEAKDIVVEGNTFIGAGASVAFVGVDRAVVRFNTFYRPQRWAIRVLQETMAAGFVPCRNGRFTDNIVAFHSTQWSSGGVNIGGNTAPGTFQFARNWWYCLDDPPRSRPSLPVAEGNGSYGRSPQFRDAEAGDLRLEPESPARGVGAEALSD